MRRFLRRKHDDDDNDDDDDDEDIAKGATGVLMVDAFQDKCLMVDAFEAIDG